MSGEAVPTQEVLGFLNPVFELLGGHSLEGLPCGLQGEPYDCVVARAFAQATGGRSVHVGSEHLSVYFLDDAMVIAQIWHGRRPAYRGKYDAEETLCYEIKMPDGLVDFIQDFDEGMYPELIADEDNELMPTDGGGCGSGTGGAPVLHNNIEAGGGVGSAGAPSLLGGSESGGATQPALSLS